MENTQQYLKRVSRASKATLIAAIYKDAGPGTRWIIGGPEHWSHDELVNYVYKRRISL